MDTPFDVQFCFPARELENDLVKLTPFIPEVYAEVFVEATLEHLEVYDRLTFGPYRTAEEFIQGFVEPEHQRSTSLLYVVLDKTRDNALAGMAGFREANEHWVSIEIGPILIFPAFRRSHVAANTIGLLLQYALDSADLSYVLPPQSSRFVNTANTEDPASALGLRRVTWRASTDNMSSIRAALRMGFKNEGTSRWLAAMPEGKFGEYVPVEEGRRGGSRQGAHVEILAVCWDTWKAGSRELASKAMELRKPVVTEGVAVA